MRCLSNANYEFQRGAIGISSALVLLMLVMLTAIVVDSGRLWMQQKQLQSIADMAAIDASRYLGCNADMQNIMQMAQQSALNNGFNGQLSDNPNQVLLGKLTTVQGMRQFTADGSGEAVYVHVTRSVPSSLIAGGMIGSTVTLHAEAVSISSPSLATFSVGTSAVSINSQQSVLLNGLLGGMLGSSLNLDLISYQGIANTKVSLQDILTASGQVGTLDSLLSTDMQIGNLLELIANAAGQNSLANAEAISAMQTIAALTVSNASLKLSDILAVSTPDPNAAAALGLNALSLITAAAMIANGTNAINIPLAVNVSSISNIVAQVTVIEPPQIAIGPAAGTGGQLCTVAKTAQIKASVGVLVNIPLLANIDLLLNTEVAQGSAGLRSIQQNDSESDVVIEASSGIAALTLTNNAGTGPARISTLLNIPLADIQLNLPLQPANSQNLEYAVANPVKSYLPQTQMVSSSLGGSLQNVLAQSNSLSITVLSILNLGLVNSVISTIVSPLLSSIGQVLLDPLLDLLGINVSGMTVTLDDLQYRETKPLEI